MKNSKLDWKGVGQFLAIMVRFCTFVMDVMKSKQIGIEIFDWFDSTTGRGHLRLALDQLGYLYKRSHIQHIIDFDSEAVCPEGLKVASADWQIESCVRGVYKPEDIQISLGIDIRPASTLTLNRGYDVCKKLRTLRAQVLGPQLLDFYLKHPNLVPEEIKTGDWVCFWGTIYVGESNNVYVRCLRWDGTCCVEGRFRLGDLWTKCFKVAVLISPR